MPHSKDIIKTIIVISALSLNITAFADDGLTPGPGLFSGASGEFNLGKILSNERQDNQASPRGRQDLSQVVASAETNVARNGANYSLYKEWRKLNQQNPELYDNFKVWLEYKAFLKQQ